MCVKKDYINGKNPTLNIEIQTESGSPKFFTVDQCIELMNSVVKVPSMVGYYSLCLFGGIRPEEVERMTWDNIIMNEHTNEIHIPAEIAKTKKARMMTMEPTLVEWLKSVDKTKQLIPANLRKLKDKARVEISFDWIHDVLRHNFATYHYAKYHDLNILRNIMGNSSSVIESFYKGVISSVQVEKFWNIKPV